MRFKLSQLIISIFSVSIVSSSFANTIEPSNTKQAEPYNIILIINDQESFHLAPAPGFELAARQQLAKHGVTFVNHYTAAAMCSPSRATFLTGMPPQINGVFDQMEYSYVPTLDPKRANVGSVLKSLGYRTAYFGKFEMNKGLLESKDNVNYSTLARDYGFDTFNFNGDVGGAPQQGYSVDSFFMGEAIQWLRQNAKVTQKEQKPFFMVLSLLNPHDIMFADVNISGTALAQKPGINIIMPPPLNTIYAQRWQFQLPTTLHESLNAKGMPSALKEYQSGWSEALGFIPTDRLDMWTYYYNYYLNALRDNDKSLAQVLDTITEMDLWKNTIIILTADHGEMAGTHGGLRGKGPMVYERNAHIPLIIAHPKALPGSQATALTSHLDLLPTIVGLTGLPAEKRTSVTGQLPGHDFSFLLTTPAQQKDIHAVRPGILFNYVGISTIDGSYLAKTLESCFAHQALPALTEVNMAKRGFLSFVFDGRYKYARYYAPNAFNTPQTFSEIFKYNDVQLFDLQTDPEEAKNLALEPEKNKGLIMRMNKLLNDLLAKEVGKNNGSFLPSVLQDQVHDVSVDVKA